MKATTSSTNRLLRAPSPKKKNETNGKRDTDFYSQFSSTPLHQHKPVRRNDFSAGSTSANVFVTDTAADRRSSLETIGSVSRRGSTESISQQSDLERSARRGSSGSSSSTRRLSGLSGLSVHDEAVSRKGSILSQYTVNSADDAIDSDQKSEEYNAHENNHNWGKLIEQVQDGSEELDRKDEDPSPQRVHVADERRQSGGVSSNAFASWPSDFAIGDAVSPGSVQGGSENSWRDMIRKQMEVLEERLAGQIARVALQNERLREAAFARPKAISDNTAAESSHMTVDRRFAELNGNLKDLRGEMESQIRRVDAADSRLHEFRRETDEHWRLVAAEIEKQLQSVASATRKVAASAQDGEQRMDARVLKLEEDLDSTMRTISMNQNQFQSLNARIETAESTAEGKSTPTQRDVMSGLTAHFFSPNEMVMHAHEDTVTGRQDPKQNSEEIQSLQGAMRQLVAQSTQAQSLLEEHEVRLVSMRAKLDAQDDHCRSISDRLERFDWENRFEQSRKTVIELGRRVSEAFDQLEMCSKSLIRRDADLDQLRKQLKQGSINGRQNLAYGGPPGSLEEVSHRLHENENCVKALEKKMQTLSIEVHLLRTQGSGGGLVNQLTEVVPRVEEHKRSCREAQQKLRELSRKFDDFNKFEAVTLGTPSGIASEIVMDKLDSAAVALAETVNSSHCAALRFSEFSGDPDTVPIVPYPDLVSQEQRREAAEVFHMLKNHQEGLQSLTSDSAPMVQVEEPESSSPRGPRKTVIGGKGMDLKKNAQPKARSTSPKSRQTVFTTSPRESSPREAEDDTTSSRKRLGTTALSGNSDSAGTSSMPLMKVSPKGSPKSSPRRTLAPRKVPSSAKQFQEALTPLEVPKSLVTKPAGS
eukprot:gnl/MRDRNA2_/MRDRNA2_107071_c0_seq1.p1 gnl/MRDRNA2_/MRDRNA2_107071_c0~~gnl/MRDRNA2_/MRDRNA2_107071_c0_seq1.p1  ORF type:complete len:873 (+),score=174.06 gnl/MRDRNA2_/MRDRNA2_107071_c0_seq1:124-2742(+)